MGDRTSVVVEIGGNLPTTALEDLADAIAQEGLSLDWQGPTATGAELRDSVEGDHPLRVMNSETYASIDAIAAVCTKHHLCWRMTWDAYPGSYDAGGELHDFEGDTEYATNGTDGQVFLSAHEILALGSWEAVCARLARLDAALPGFVVTDA